MSTWFMDYPLHCLHFKISGNVLFQYIFRALGRVKSLLKYSLFVISYNVGTFGALIEQPRINVRLLVNYTFCIYQPAYLLKNLSAFNL